MSDTEVGASLQGAVGLVELRRPPHNLLDFGFLGSLAQALTDLAAETDCRALVLASEGRSFCAGANFRGPGALYSAAQQSPADAFRDYTARLYAEAERIFAVPKPVVAAVHGPAVGAGVGLALACDLRVSCPEAFFAANFVRLGIHPGFATTVTLPALIGPSRASDMLLTGRRVGGEEAMAMGLVDRLVPAEEVRSAAQALAGEIAAAAPLAVAATRATLRGPLLARVKAQLAHEAAEQAKLIATADAVEGISAMLGRREPRFSGEESP